MKNKFPKLHTSNLAQELYTPPEATAQMVPILKVNNIKTIWECCYGRGDMANELRKDFKVVGGEGQDFFETKHEADCIMTNPPFRHNKEFLARAFSLDMPFIFLIRLEHLGGVKAKKLFENKKVNVLIPEKRINFITPKMRQGLSVGGSQFHCVWIMHKLTAISGEIDSYKW